MNSRFLRILGKKLGRTVRFGFVGIAALLFCLETLTVSCRDNLGEFETGRNPLWFSSDTVFFDTIISTLNMPVKRFTIHNRSQKPVKISRIYIRSGESGFRQGAFRFTVNGDTSGEVRDLLIEGRDSVFVFVRTGIPLSGQNLPFIVDAYFQCDMADCKSSQSVYLYAFGQDAHYWHPDRLLVKPYPNADKPNVIDTQYIRYFIWSPQTHSFEANDKPYAIFGYLTVEEGQTLDIPAGTRLHFAPGSGIWVQKGGTLRINGTLERPVLLSGLRLDTLYKNQAGQWGHVWLDAESKGHQIRYAIIENGTNGLWLDSVANPTGETPNLLLENTIIKNMANCGLTTYSNHVQGHNLVIGNCKNGVVLKRGGRCQLVHCTLGDFSGNNAGDGYSLKMEDESLSGNTRSFSGCLFVNCIFCGISSNQIYLDLTNNQDNDYLFDHCLIRQREATHFGNINKFPVCLFNLDPKFYNPQKADFRIADTTSAAYGKGLPTNVFTDITNLERPLFPTLGAYEYRAIEENAAQNKRR